MTIDFLLVLAAASSVGDVVTLILATLIFRFLLCDFLWVEYYESRGLSTSVCGFVVIVSGKLVDELIDPLRRSLVQKSSHIWGERNTGELSEG